MGNQGISRREAMAKLGALAAASALGAGKASGADELPDFETQLEWIRRRNRLPALTAAAVLDGVIVSIGATGVRKYGAEDAVTVDDQWQLGSCTKAMTATLAGMMVEQGFLHWSTTVADVFPELRQIMDDDWEKVTLEQLLTHRGGAPAHPPDDLWLRALLQRGTPTQQRLKFIGGLLTRRTEAAPGAKFIYSNQGYAIAGAMLERMTAVPWEEMMRTWLFEPLGMDSAGFGAPGVDDDDMAEPWGHLGTPRKPEPVPPGPGGDNPPSIAPAGGVHCSITDLAKFCAFHAAEGTTGPFTADGQPLLSPESFKRLHSRFGREDYALGWVVERRAWGGGDVLMHTGSNTMWYCTMWVAPKNHAGFVAATNCGFDSADDGCDAAVKAMVERVLGEEG